MGIRIEGNIEKVCNDLKRFKTACEKIGITLNEYIKSMRVAHLRKICSKQLEQIFKNA